MPLWLGTALERREYFLIGALDRARRFHRLLRRDVPDFGVTRYDLIANLGNETSSRAVLSPVKGVWKTRFADDKEVLSRNPILRSAVVVGRRWSRDRGEPENGCPLRKCCGSGRTPWRWQGPIVGSSLQEATHRRILQILAASPTPWLVASRTFFACRHV